MEKLTDKQLEAINTLLNSSSNGVINMTMRSGKTRVFIEYLIKANFSNILWLAFDTQERDVDLENEFKKWNQSQFYYDHITAIHPRSIHKEDIDTYDCVVYNEAHGITEKIYQYLAPYSGRILGLTGTMPKKKDKLDLFSKLNLDNILHEYSWDEASQDGNISDYEIEIHKLKLDTDFNYQVEYKDKVSKEKKSFITSEYKSYMGLKRKLEGIEISLKPWLDQKEINNKKIDAYKPYKEESVENQSILRSLYSKNTDINNHCKPFWFKKKMFTLQLMQFLNKLPSKIRFTKQLIINHAKNKKRILVFSQDTKHASDIGKYTYHSKNGKEHLKAFKKKEIPYLVLVNKGATGGTYHDIDTVVLLNVNSSNTSVLQKIARGMVKDLKKPLRIVILITEDTIQEKWIAKALEDLDQNKIKYIDY